MHTKLGICAKKKRFRTEQEARDVADKSGMVLRPYRCALCRDYHLTSRTKGMRIPKP